VKPMRPSYEMKRYTLPQLLKLRAQREGDRVALRQKDYGIWNEYTYEDYYGAVRDFGHGLLALPRRSPTCSTTPTPSWCWPRTRSRWTSSSRSATGSQRCAR